MRKGLKSSGWVCSEISKLHKIFTKEQIIRVRVLTPFSQKHSLGYRKQFQFEKFKYLLEKETVFLERRSRRDERAKETTTDEERRTRLRTKTERGRGKEVMESSSLWASGRYFEFPFNLKYKDAVPAALPWNSQPSQSKPSLSKRPRLLRPRFIRPNASVPPLASSLIVDVGRIRELISQRNSLRRKPPEFLSRRPRLLLCCLPSLRMHFREKARRGISWNIETRYFWETTRRSLYFLKHVILYADVFSARNDVFLLDQLIHPRLRLSSKKVLKTSKTLLLKLWS